MYILDIIFIQKQLMGIASLIKEMSGKKAILGSLSIYVDHISEKVLNSPDRQILVNWSIWASSTYMFSEGKKPPKSS
jgi:hypothetical protein